MPVGLVLVIMGICGFDPVNYISMQKKYCWPIPSQLLAFLPQILNVEGFSLTFIFHLFTKFCGFVTKQIRGILLSS